MIKLVGKRGDTLIEVMLAVGIFSMVAVAVVAVMSSGTSSAQTALETTLAREEIDAQAEALRFIQSAYIADKNAGTSGKYSKLWKAITEDNDKLIVGESNIEGIANYAPTSCDALYNQDNGEVKNYGFIINTKKLGNFSSEDINRSVIYKMSSGKLVPAATYPHLYFNENKLIDSGSANLYNAQGIYIIVVRDPGTTIMSGDTTNESDRKQSAYYDFYIRTCWYGTGDQVSSNISTVIRLYDPDVIKETTSGYEIKYYNDDGTSEHRGYLQFIPSVSGSDTTVTLSQGDGRYIKGWSCTTSNIIQDFSLGAQVNLNELTNRGCKAPNSNTIKLYAVRGQNYNIKYYGVNNQDLGFSPGAFNTTDADVRITNSEPSAAPSGKQFSGWWSCSAGPREKNYEKNSTIEQHGANGGDFTSFIENCAQGNTIKLYAVWEDAQIQPQTINITASWTSDSNVADLDGMPEVYISGSPISRNNMSCGVNTSGKYGCVRRFSISLAGVKYMYADVTRYVKTTTTYTCILETFIGRCPVLSWIPVTNYEYSGFNGTLTVSLSSGSSTKDSSDITAFNINNGPTNSKKYWNILKVQNGVVTWENTTTSSPNTSY